MRMIANLAVCAALPLVPVHAKNQRDMLLVILDEEVSGKNGAHEQLMTRHECLQVITIGRKPDTTGLEDDAALLDPSK
jgi:hypothetical protein